MDLTNTLSWRSSSYLHLEVKVQFVRFIGEDETAGLLLDTATRDAKAGLGAVTSLEYLVFGVSQGPVGHNLSPRRLGARGSCGKCRGGAAIYRGVGYFLSELK